MIARGIVFALALALCAGAWGQAPKTYEPPRLSDGHPDFQGIWTNNWATPLERPTEISSLIITETQAAGLLFAAKTARDARPTDPDGLRGEADEFPRVRGELRSSMIIDPADGKLPYTTEGRAQRARYQAERELASEPEERLPLERCLGGPGRAPILSYPASNIRQIVQTSDAMMIWSEHGSDVRVIPFDGRRWPPAQGGWQGQLYGRWEKDTLVVETSGFGIGDWYRHAPGSPLMISTRTTVRERFTRISEDEILSAFTVEDPLLYSRAWTAETVLRASGDQMYEYACHEGNYSMVNILRSTRIAEARADPVKRQNK